MNGRFKFIKETISIPFTLTTNEPRRGATELIETEISDPKISEIRFADRLNIPHCLHASIITFASPPATGSGAAVDGSAAPRFLLGGICG